MKIRAFGSAVVPVVAGRADADVLISKDANVHVHAGALEFRRDATDKPSPAQTRTLRGQILLETLRAGGDVEGFGGQVKGGVDVPASLKSYFRSLEIAELALAKGGGEAVLAYVEGLPLPDDIRAMVGATVGSIGEPARPIGADHTFENDRDYNQMWAAFQRADPVVLQATDATITKLLANWGTGNDLSQYANFGDADFKLGALRFFARAKELGLAVTANGYAQVLTQLPQTPAAQRTVVRFVTAFQIDPKTVVFRGRPLLQTAASKAVGSPLGRDGTWRDKADLWPAQLAAGNIKSVKIDDATVRALADVHQQYTHPHTMVQQAHANLKEGAVLVLARARELGIASVRCEAGIMPHIAKHLPATLDAATAFARFGRAAGVDVSASVIGNKSVADWLTQAGTSSSRNVPSGTAALGRVTTWESDGSYQNVHAAAHQNPKEARAISDATLTKWFSVWGPNNELTAYYSDGDATARLTYAGWWARGKELGLSATCAGGHALQRFANGMDASAECAHALRRVGLAFGIDVEHVLLAGRTAISTYPRRLVTAELALPPRAPLADAAFSAAQIEAAIEKCDEAVLAADDATLKSLVELQPDFAALMNVSGDRGWQLRVLDVCERGLAIDTVCADQALSAMRAVSYRNLDDVTIAERLATLAARASLPASSVTLSGGTTLAVHAATKPHVEKVERVLQGVNAPLTRRRSGDSLGDAVGAQQALGAEAGPYSPLWNARDVRVFALGDNPLKAEMMSLGDFGWFGHFNNDPGVISLNARLCELNNAANPPVPDSAAALAIRGWLAQPVPEQFGTADALPRVLRAALAAGVDPDTVVVMRGAARVALLKHPAMAALLKVARAPEAARGLALTHDVALLNAREHASSREGAALRLLGVGDNSDTHELSELLPALLAALHDGSAERVDLTALPKKHVREFLATAFARDEHPAVIALLVGMLLRVKCNDIEALLLAKGQLPSVSADLAAVAEQLTTLSAEELSFVALGIDKDPPELASLALRAWLLSDPPRAELLKRLNDGSVDSSALCVALLERTVHVPQQRRALLLDVVQTAIDSERVAKDSVVALLGAGTIAALDQAVIEGATRAVEAYLNAAPADVGQARAQLIAALGAPTWLDDPNVVAAAALKTAIAHDLLHVAPLSEVDVAAGIVVGKPWQSRLIGNKVARVGAIKLPIEGDVREHSFAAGVAGTGESNLHALAARWLTRRPVSVSGVDADLAVAAIAAATGAKVFACEVTPQTTAEQLLAPDGAVGMAVAQGAVAQLSLSHGAWPEGLGKALLQGAPKARIVTVGLPLPGLATLMLAPLDAESIKAHLSVCGVASESAAASSIAEAFVAIRDEARAGTFEPLGESDFPLALLDRIARRLSPKAPGEEPHDDDVNAALTDLLARRITGDARDRAMEIIDACAPASQITADRRVVASQHQAAIDELKVQVVGDVEDGAMPLLVAADHDAFKAAARALELGEAVVADDAIAQRVGTLYGTLTGRDVHIHVLTADSSAQDVLDAATDQTVLVLREFFSAPASTREAVLAAVDQGRVRVVAGDASRAPRAAFVGSLVGALVLRAPPLSEADLIDQLTLHARSVGLPVPVATAALGFRDELQALTTSGQVVPLVELTDIADLESALELCAQLASAMPMADAFSTAMSATFPVEAQHQERVDALARKLAGQ